MEAVWALRQTVVAESNDELLEITAASIPISADMYRSGLLSGNLWGDQFCLMTLATVYRQDVTVITATTACTFTVGGGFVNKAAGLANN